MTQFELKEVRLEVPDHVQTPGLIKRLAAGTYEETEANAAVARVQPGMRVLELGAGLGYVSTTCAARAGAENLLSIEANPALIPVIRANLDRNGHHAARLRLGAVTGGQGEGEILFQANAAFLGGSIARPDAAEEEVVAVPELNIRDLLAEHRPNVVVMDIEGSEQWLFDKPWNPQLRFLIVELHPPRYGMKAIKRIVDCMSETGLTYDPVTSSGRVLGFRRVWGEE